MLVNVLKVKIKKNKKINKKKILTKENYLIYYFISKKKSLFKF